MTQGLLLKGAALVVFLGVLGGAAYGVQTFLGEDVAALALQMEAPRETVNATPGYAVTYPVVVHNRGDESLTVSLRATGPAEGATGEHVVPARSNATFFLRVDIPAALPAGAHRLAVAAVDAEGEVLRQRADLLRLRILEPAVGFGEGDTVAVRYTGRTPAGEVFDTNDPFVYPLNLTTTSTFTPHGDAPLRVEHANPRVIEGFFEGLQGMQPGESRTITFPPEKGYGPEMMPEEYDRIERMERVYDLELTTETVARDVFDDYIRDSNQGDPADYEPGDVFFFEQLPNRWPYQLVVIDADKIEYRLAVKLNETYTLFPFWEGASRVESVNETHARFFTTPTTAVNETLTVRSYWPDMSAIVEVTDEEILVRHSPEVGYKFRLGGQGQAPQEAIVQEITDDRIVVGVRSDNPLAGMALTFDVEILEITR